MKSVDWAAGRLAAVFQGPGWKWMDWTVAVARERPAGKVNILLSCRPELALRLYRMRAQDKQTLKSKAVTAGFWVCFFFCCLSTAVTRCNVKLGVKFIRRSFPGARQKCAVDTAVYFWGSHLRKPYGSFLQYNTFSRTHYNSLYWIQY